MNIPLVTRNPTYEEIERFRLILSTYQDGSGQQSMKNGATVPGWRDFERSVALVFGGEAKENKYIFDVLIPDCNQKLFYGVSCKMRRTLNDTKRTGRVTLELSNSSGTFWDKLLALGIHQRNYKNKPLEVAQALVNQENEWHQSVSVDLGGDIDLSNSFYLALSWNPQGEYQLFKFSLVLPNPAGLDWDFPIVKNTEKIGRRLRGRDNIGTLFEWYGESGGQLKYYPLVENALWKSNIFSLEPLPKDWREKHGILKKARDYFPECWKVIE